MAATAITPIELSFNTVENTKRTIVTSTGTTAGSTFAIATSLLGDYGKVVIGLFPTTVAEKQTVTVYGSEDFAGGKNENYVKEFSSTGGSTRAYNFLGPFESARYKSTSGLKFNIKASTAGGTLAFTNVIAIGLPGYK